MSYRGGYGRGYRIEYDYRSNVRPGAQGHPGASAPAGPSYTQPGGGYYFPPSAPGFLSAPQMYETPQGSMGSGRPGPPVEYTHSDRSQTYPSSSVGRGFEKQEQDWGRAQEQRQDVDPHQVPKQKLGVQQPIDIDAILKDERLKNVLFSGISKATQKLEQSLRGKPADNPENVMFLSESKKGLASALFPSASGESQAKPKSILKKKGESRPDDADDPQTDKLSVLEKTLQLLRGRTNLEPAPEQKASVVSRPSGALGQLSSYSDDPEDEEAHLYGEKRDDKKTNYSKGLPFWSVGAAPSETEAAKRDSSGTFDVKEKLYEEWRNSINKKEPEKPKSGMSQLQAFLSNQMSAAASQKTPSTGVKDNEELDSTVQNILHSIGFNFDLSKRMQELARQKKKEHDDLNTGIVDQTASFLEKVGEVEDMRKNLFPGSTSSIDSLIKQARAETQSSRQSYENFSERSRSPEPRGRRRERDRSMSEERISHRYKGSPERRPPSTWSPEDDGDFRRREQRRAKEHRRSQSSERSAATPPRGNSFSSQRRDEPSGHGRGHHLSERFRDTPKDEYYYPDEHEATDVPPSMPLLKSYSSQKKNEDLSGGLFPSSKRMHQTTDVENFTVMSRNVEGGDDSFSGTRRIILPSKSDRRVVSKSKSPSFTGSRSPFHSSYKRSASPISPPPAKERRYLESRKYDLAPKPTWDIPKYDMKITTFRDQSPVGADFRYESPPQSPYADRDREFSQDFGNRRELLRPRDSYEREYASDAKYRSPERDKRSYDYEKQWAEGRGSQEREKYQSPRRFRSPSPEYKYGRSPPRYKSPDRQEGKVQMRDWRKYSPKRRSVDRDKSPARRRSPSPARRRSPSPVRRRSPSPGRRRSRSPARRKSPPSSSRRRSPNRRPNDNYKRDSYSKYSSRDSRDTKDSRKQSSYSSSSRSKYSSDSRKKSTQESKSKTSSQSAKVDLSKMSDSERKAHLNKLLASKDKIVESNVPQTSTPAGVEVPKALPEKKSAEKPPAKIPEKPADSTPAEASAPEPEKTKVNLMAMTPEERKAFFMKTLEGKKETSIKSSLLTAVERLSALSVDARKEVLVQMSRMTEKEREGAMSNLSLRQVKVSALKAKLERLKREQNELMRKSQRSGLGTQDPHLIKNTEEQNATHAEIERLSSFDPKRPFAEVDVFPPPSPSVKEAAPPQKKKETGSVTVVKAEGVKAKPVELRTDSKGQAKGENWTKVTADAGKLPDLGEPAKKTSRGNGSAKKDNANEKRKGQNASSTSSPSSFGSTQSKIYFEYIDGGNHWCKYCSAKCNSIDQLFNHLHGKKHMAAIQREPKPWKDAKSDPKPTRQKVGHACTRRVKGSEMLFPVMGFHCSLCKLILPDLREASDHLKSDGHHNKYLDYIKAHPNYEKKLLLERAFRGPLSPDRSNSPPPPTPPLPPLPPPPPPSTKKRSRGKKADRAKKQLRKPGKDVASSGSEDDMDYGPDNIVVEDMDLDEEEEEEAMREAKSKVPKLSGKDLSRAPVAASTSAQPLDNMKEYQEDEDKPLGQFLSIGEGPKSGSSKLPVVPSAIDLKSIPIPTGPPVEPEPSAVCTVKSLKEIHDEEKKMMGIDVDAEEEQPLSAIPVPPPALRAESVPKPPTEVKKEELPSEEAAQKKPKSLDNLFAKINLRVASRQAKSAAVKGMTGGTLTAMELRIQQEIQRRVEREKMKILRQKEKEERAKKPEEPTYKKKVYSDSSSSEEDDTPEDSPHHQPGEGEEESTSVAEFDETQFTDEEIAHCHNVTEAAMYRMSTMEQIDFTSDNPAFTMTAALPAEGAEQTTKVTEGSKVAEPAEMSNEASHQVQSEEAHQAHNSEPENLAELQGEGVPNAAESSLHADAQQKMSVFVAQDAENALTASVAPVSQMLMEEAAVSDDNQSLAEILAETDVVEATDMEEEIAKQSDTEAVKTSIVDEDQEDNKKGLNHSDKDQKKIHNNISQDIVQALELNLGEEMTPAADNKAFVTETETTSMEQQTSAVSDLVCEAQEADTLASKGDMEHEFPSLPTHDHRTPDQPAPGGTPADGFTPQPAEQSTLAAEYTYVQTAEEEKIPVARFAAPISQTEESTLAAEYSYVQTAEEEKIPVSVFVPVLQTEQSMSAVVLANALPAGEERIPAAEHAPILQTEEESTLAAESTYVQTAEENTSEVEFPPDLPVQEESISAAQFSPLQCVEEESLPVNEIALAQPVEDESTPVSTDFVPVLSGEEESTPAVESPLVHSGESVEKLTPAAAVFPLEYVEEANTPSVEIYPLSHVEESTSVVEFAPAEPEEKGSAPLVEFVPVQLSGEEEIRHSEAPSVCLLVSEAKDTTLEMSASVLFTETESSFAVEPSFGIAQSNTSTTVNSDALLVEAVVLDDEIKKDQSHGTKRGRGRGKRGTGRGKGRKAGKLQNAEFSNPVEEQETGTEQLLATSISTHSDMREPEPGITHQSPTRKRGRGRRGQAARSVPDRGRVTRSALLKTEDINLEQGDALLPSEAEEIEQALVPGEGEDLITASHEAERVTAEAYVLNLDADDTLTLPDNSEALGGSLEEMKHAELQSVPTEVHEMGDVPEQLADSVPDVSLAAQGEAQQPQSPCNDETDSDATITDDVEAPLGLPDQDEPDAVVPPSLLDSQEHVGWSNVNVTDALGIMDELGREALALQSVSATSGGSPAMDPPMSGVVSETDEAVETVTFAEEEGLLGGADSEAPSAGISLDIADTDEPMEFDMKNMDESL